MLALVPLVGIKFRPLLRTESCGVVRTRFLARTNTLLNPPEEGSLGGLLSLTDRPSEETSGRPCGGSSAPYQSLF